MLVEAGAEVHVLNQRGFADVRFDLSVDAWGRVDGLLTIGRRSLLLHEVNACYARLMDDARFRRCAPCPRARAPEHSRQLLEAITTWMDVAPGRIVNRPGAMASNASKPYQAQVIARHGLRVPETLVTNDPKEALEFYRTHDRVVFKSASGVRSIVQSMREEDLERIERVPHAPGPVPGLRARSRRTSARGGCGGVRHRDRSAPPRTTGMRPSRSTRLPSSWRRSSLTT